MLAQQVAQKYARGLFLSVKGKNLVDKAYDQLADLRDFIRTDPTLMNFLVAPHVLDEHKMSLIEEVFSGRLHRLFIELLKVLVEKHRVAFLEGIIDEFVRLVEAEKGIARVTVLTAVSLTQGEKDRLAEKLAGKMGLTIHLEEKIDSDIIAGVVVVTHNEIIDGSVRRGLDLIEGQLSKVRVH